MRGARGGTESQRESYLPLSGARQVVDSLIEGCVLAAVLLMVGVGLLIALPAAFVFSVIRIARKRGVSLVRLAKRWPSRGRTWVDGMYVGVDAVPGELFEVYDPPWWRLDRWLSWWTARGRAKRTTTVLDADEAIEMRVLSVRYDPPSPKRRYVDR